MTENKPKKVAKKAKVVETEVEPENPKARGFYQPPLRAPLEPKPVVPASKPTGRVTSVDIQHALRASLLLETEGGGLQSTYSSLEVGIQIHVEGIPEGADYKEVVADYASDVMQMVAQRVNEDARALGFKAFTEGTEDEIPGGDSLPVSEDEL